MNVIDKTKIKGILFDSGYVLVYPTGANNWFISPKFFEIINNKDITLNDLNKGFSNASDILSTDLAIYNREEEIECFKKFYTKAFKSLNLDVSDNDIESLAIDISDNPEKYAFYEDSKPALEMLQKKFKLALVSDAWPSMRKIYEYNNMDKYFDTLVISSELATLKPDKLMYRTAMDVLELKPEECIFLDDNINNCIGAKKIGITPILVSRNHEDYVKNMKQYKDYINIENLQELVELIY